MKAILKEHWRYIVFRAEAEKECNKDEFEKSLNRALLQLIGEMGMAKAVPRLIAFKWPAGIVKVSRDAIDQIRAALALVTKLDGAKAHLITTFTSGTLAGAKRNAKL